MNIKKLRNITGALFITLLALNTSAKETASKKCKTVAYKAAEAISSANNRSSYYQSYDMKTSSDAKNPNIIKYTVIGYVEINEIDAIQENFLVVIDASKDKCVVNEVKRIN